MWLLLVLVLAVLSCAANASIMPNPIGETIPNGDIYVESGGSLIITCVVYGKSDEKDLKFTSDKIDVSSYVSKINATAIRLHVKNPKPQSQMFRCLKGDQIVDQNFVFVAVKPSDMKCLSYNYDRLNCSFQSSELPSNTRYEARYELGGIRHNNRRWTPIENITSTDYQGYYFVLDESTALQYRFIYGEFKLFLKITIEFPKSKLLIEYVLNASFDETKHVIPGTATNLKVTTITSDNIEIAYELSKKMTDINYPLEHMIVWSCKCGKKEWHNKTNFNTTAKTMTFNITDLPYAYALCNVSVFLKASEAAFDDMWSSNATIDAIRTGSTIPERPEALPGAFQILHKSNETYVAVYWREVPEELRNGANFLYEVIVGEASAQTEKTHAIVKVEDSANTTLEIRSKNNVGESVEKSIVVIPKRSDIVTANLQSFTQWSNASGITYLAWQSPVNTTEGFVVFACQDWNQQTQLCNGQLEMTDVVKSPNGNYYYLKSTKKHKYAVALKTHKNWTGLFWSKCTIDDSTHKGLPLPEIQLSITAVGMSKIGLDWVLNCKDMIVPITGYVVSYCIMSPENLQECGGELQNITVPGDRTIGSCEIENLKADTRYFVWVTTQTLFGKQQKSKFLPYYNESKPNLTLVYWTVGIGMGIFVVILTAISSKMLYRKLLDASDIYPNLPEGLKPVLSDNSINKKRIQWIRRPLGTKMQEITPKSKANVPPHLVTQTSEVSLQLSMDSQGSEIAAKPELPTRNNYIAISDLQPKAYFKIGTTDDDDNKSSPNDFSHSYVQSGTVPDLLQLPTKQQSDVQPYVALGEETAPYVVAGQKEQLQHPIPYVALDDLHKSTLEQNTATPQMPFEAISEKAVLLEDHERPYVIAGVKDDTKPTITSYVPLENFSEAPEEVPLLHLPSEVSRHYVALGKADLPPTTRPYVTVGDLVRGTYSDTPARFSAS